MTDIVTAVVWLAGSAFALLAAVGILRMPDVFTRMASCDGRRETDSHAAVLRVSPVVATLVGVAAPAIARPKSIA